MTTHKGRCQCGAVTIEVTGDPEWTASCHCADCRRATGAAMSAFAGYLTGNTEIAGESYSEYESSPGVFRGFCSACGSRLTYRSTRWPEQLHFHAGAFDDPNAFAPTGNVYVAEKISWAPLEPDLPAFDTVPSEAD